MVTNHKIFTFPLTGGYRVTIFALAGLLLIGMAGLIYIKQKRKVKLLRVSSNREQQIIK